jgi:hypothetical protein
MLGERATWRGVTAFRLLCFDGIGRRARVDWRRRVRAGWAGEHRLPFRLGWPGCPRSLLGYFNAAPTLASLHVSGESLFVALTFPLASQGPSSRSFPFTLVSLVNQGPSSEPAEIRVLHSDLD